ncbi:MAG TPA: xanthine dehydrogenase family protein molybdopterin-binding subunit [Acetobacteraceae bacterium]|jgi:carbon-monoxide dehydrogenase large subunit|nr:xanthine dehydrogenase family protein molybdopterin-binding subunit [Acetobacteraceae bacterium]
MLTFKGRKEDMRLVRGQGQYSSDWNLPGQLHACFLRADHAHAAIRSVDTAAAKRIEGVVAVLDGADLVGAGMRTLPPTVPYVGRGGARILMPERPALAQERVRYVGEEVAVVIAETMRQAMDAAECINIEYDDLPAATGIDDALAAGAPQLHENIPGNVCFDFEYGDEAATAAAIASAPHVARLTVESPRVAPVPMEPRAVLASFNEATEQYEIRCSHQGVGVMSQGLAVMLGVDPDRIRVNIVDVGGAFGPRGSPYAEYAVLLHAAKRLGRPIKWVATRSEDFATDSHGRGIRLTGELALDTTGRFLALRTQWLCDEGAYLTTSGALTNTINGQLMAAGPYRTPLLYGRHRLVMTNATPTNAYRGAGRPEAAYLIERLVDHTAATLNLDPIELRRRNALTREAMPYRTPTGSEFDSGDPLGLLDAAQGESSWDTFPLRRANSTRAGRLRGIGCSLFQEPSGAGSSPKDEVAIIFADDGRVLLYMAAQSSGQGHETVFSELVAMWLGLDREHVVLRAGDPDGPKLTGSGAFGSRTGMIQSNVFKLATDEVIRKALPLASEMLEADTVDLEFREGSFTVKGTDRSIAMTTIVERVRDRSPHPLDTVSELPIFRAFPSGAHVAEVEIDPETGAVEVLAYTAVDDMGTVLSPVLAAGQVRGGIVQGAGQVFGECCIYDPDSGQLLTGSFMDYVMPHADLMCPIVIIDRPVRSPTNALGMKGVGESGTIGAAPALMNAIADALRGAGIDHFDMPATPMRVWAALDAAERTTAGTAVG